MRMSTSIIMNSVKYKVYSVKYKVYSVKYKV